MFHPLGVLKKKPAEAPVETANEPAAKQVRIDDIEIHVMPERFRGQLSPSNSSKKTGLLIIGGGIVFLLVVIAALYFLIFRKPAVETPPVETAPLPTPTVEETTPAPVQPEISQPPTNQLTPEPGTTTPETIPEPATTTPETIEEEIPLGLIPAVDSDNDGLTNIEEIILGTSTSTPDSDSDGYLDGAELMSFYNPASANKLTDNPSILPYQNQTYKYSVLYPAAWRLTVNGGDDSIIFRSDDNQFFQIIVQSNPSGQTIDQWYMEQLAAFSIESSMWVSGDNWQGIKNLDGLTAYLMDSQKKYIFTLAYNPGENNILDYINLFNMMIRSFTISQ